MSKDAAHQELSSLSQWIKNIPPYAKLLPQLRGADVTISAPMSDQSSLTSPDKSSPSSSPTSATSKFNISSVLLSSAVHLPTTPPSSPRTHSNLMSARAPLSIPTTAVNFRRFVGKATPVFWIQDRVEEILLWRKGWKLTCAWMAAYCLLCYFPALILLIPHIVVLTIMISTLRDPGDTRPPFRVVEPREGSSEWFANLQAIQNLMGSASDLQEFILPVVPHLTHSSPYSGPIFTLLVVSLLALLPVIAFIPLRLVALVAGLTPFILSHPLSQRLLPAIFKSLRKPARAMFTRLVDDDNLEVKHWTAPLKEVELYENERLAPLASGTADWSKSYLKFGERKGWTRGKDGWSDVTNSPEGEVSSNLMFPLEPGWAFVETEDWRIDFEGSWSTVGADDDGWVYTNDAWLDPRPEPVDEWRTKGGMTRRRRHARRIYYTGT